ncbi:CobW-like GTP-binding protein [Pseudomonas nicosulfuronedens]|uniref:Cobalamin biosynthesis protein CobW n=1 Tax=Pseudomonas nicosulfuronedens TaxID=2571105 RepID=A0A5R9RCP1_9PSED|nr:CobW-like GTP-binding protein [Pseudomonas nicosulfuronedens]MDH1009222.1 CobW-like GTP-binding protein [Pseudomonas nicosulfuronedens]MDH1978134.1 CobW-like GTP-binding protein [Pseudomonas nicosulfuronedens]MDH2026986.1 CobW-like GTP-binding protein [Pseudomonas nicosulfuronedens]TLX81123.1 cobalamin biosynthesis protein CobW [Pseudomonas nicosulfuronedens]
MLKQIPTHLIAGPLGAGKTSLLQDLLAQRPAGERWAVLVNEFGQVGLDAALLSRDEDGIALGEVAGGCLCCVNGAPFQVGLGRLLRKARPQRVFIEPSGLGHPAQLLAQLHAAPWQGVLAVQPLVMVLDAAALAAGQLLPEAQQQALGDAALLLMNKSEALDGAARAALVARLPELPLRWTTQGRLSLDELPSTSIEAVGADLPQGTSPGEPAMLLRRESPLRQVRVEEGRQAVGWRFHRDWRFRTAELDAWLAGLPGLLRAKAVLHGEDAWLACNRTVGPAPWTPSAWRKDSRIELILAAELDPQALQDDLLRCAIAPI